ncbi:hypothetical protein BX600DRAFT_153957 [Xylariales sp. PMI_506]|nr:hypothetical protein BX600DRAFT_153957 [Xylariales sp. PMI_506]
MADVFVQMRQRPRQVLFGIVAFVIILVALLHFENSSGYSSTGAKGSRSKSERLYGSTYHGRSSTDINRVTNDTLGFSKVFAIALPERSDKRDALSLSAALTGFHVEFIDGVKGETIPDKAVPFGADRKALMESNLGSWRGHMNAIRRIVEENLESALIMEDDMDWDVRLRAQLEEVAKGARMVLPSGSRPSSPYGDGWDILWLGHCGEVFPEDLPENTGKPVFPKYTIHNDVTVPPLSKITGLVDFKKYPEHTRWVHIAAAPICTFAYALSQQGARKVLYDLSVDHLVGPFDNALAGFCRDGASRNHDGLQGQCITVTPPVFFHHKAKGLLSGDSDIQKVDNGKIREKGTTENIVWSARNNLKNMLLGRVMENQFE